MCVRNTVAQTTERERERKTGRKIEREKEKERETERKEKERERSREGVICRESKSESTSCLFGSVFSFCLL